MAKGTRKQFGKYRLIAHLATGGMAEIYLASHTSLAGFEKLIVIKRILPNLAREQKFVEMFLDEARIAALLNHPNVVQIFDLGRIDNQYFIAMEYLSGESLSMVVKTCRQRKTRLPPELAAGILMQASEGLHHAHTMVNTDGSALNIVHRDVSPQNIFVLYDGGVKVVDFGIAKAATRSTQTRTGVLKGKFAYMSPEQILGEDLDGRSDVFSLGIVLWECLTGRKLFKQESDLKLLQAVTQQDAPPPATINPAIPAELNEITLKALSRDREQRFESAAEFRLALSGYLKKAAGEADTLAIGNTMRDLFKDQIRKKRKLIEGAKASDVEVSDYLFGDLRQYISDTDVSIPGTTPSDIMIASGLRQKKDRRSPVTFALLGVILIGGGLLVGLYLSPKDNGPKEQPDAGALVVAQRPDAGVKPADPGQKSSDPGPSKLAAAPDAGVRAAADPLRRRRKQTRRRKRKRINKVVKVAKVEKEKPPAPPKLPPGKLRLITNPWTDVFHQGRKLGQTPLVDVELPAGTIKLRVVNTEAGIDRVITVQIKSGGKVVKRFNLF